jgi:hypothetical protein
MLESLNSTILALPWAPFNNHVMEAKQVTLFSYLKQNEDQGYWEGNLINMPPTILYKEKEKTTCCSHIFGFEFFQQAFLEQCKF